uniref:Uncharacterized protein n=1 Tax=Aegilops tauschii subsp. strangulata TaxID=200361 RepID=A0A453N2V8_AEGTS
MEVFRKFYHLAGENFHEINKAFISLLPKKEAAIEVQHFRPISLINSVVKLITKVLSMRLAAII